MLKHETLLKHAKSKSHTYSRECYLNRKARPCGALPQVLAQSRTAQQAEIQRGLEIKFNLAYTIAKEELPFSFTKFRPFLLVTRKNGVQINPTYDNDVKCAEMISVICDSMKAELRDHLQSANYMSIIIDGDTDISVKECEIVYVRLLDNGKPVNKLLGQQEVAHAHAQGNLIFI